MAVKIFEENWLNDSKIRLKKQVKGDLVELHNLYKKLLYIEDTKRLDIVFATCLSNKLAGVPIWLILVGPSGDMKSAQLSAIINEDTYVLHNLTSKSLVNGYKDKKKHPDLAPLLNNRIVLIPDMAQILKLPVVEKAELWGQLRDLYDGNAGKISGQGSTTKYSNLKITLIAGSTPAIDGQILVHQDLGTRELIYRTKGNNNKQKVMDKCIENEEFESEIRDKLREATIKFLSKREIKREYISKEILEQIKKMAIYLTYMRATAEFDNYNNTLRNDIYPEEPTRIIKQLKRLYICLMSLEEDYPQQRALDILWEVVRSSSFPLRVKVFEFLTKQEIPLSTSKIAEYLKIGKSTAQRNLNILWNLGIITRKSEETNYPDKFIYFWQINTKNQFVKEYTRPNL